MGARARLLGFCGAVPGVRYFVVACPKDFTMYREALKATGNEGRLEVKDLIEFVEDATGGREAIRD